MYMIPITPLEVLHPAKWFEIEVLTELDLDWARLFRRSVLRRPVVENSCFIKPLPETCRDFER
jgi:hypothetical protein